MGVKKIQMALILAFLLVFNSKRNGVASEVDKFTGTGLEVVFCQDERNNFKAVFFLKMFGILVLVFRQRQTDEQLYFRVCL